MYLDKLFQIGMYMLPAIITAAISFYFFKKFVENEDNRRRFMLLKDNQKHALPIKLQAYERLSLFLERINPAKLVLRVAPLNENKMDYQKLLIHHIEQEYEHNIAQQIYITNDAWTMILTAKNTIIHNIRKTTADDTVLTAAQLREKLLSNLLESESASSVALSYIKTEVTQLL
jgi:hypothetical protein